MDKRSNCSDCPLCNVEIDTYCERYCSDMADFVDEIRAKSIKDFANRLMGNEVIDKSVIRRVAEQMMRGKDNDNT